MQQKKDSFGTILAKVQPKIFLKFSAKKVLWAVGCIFNKVNKGIVENPYALGTQYCSGR